MSAVVLNRGTNDAAMSAALTGLTSLAVESRATSPARMSGGAIVSTNGAPARATGIGVTRG